ncbi:hypothetical protein CGRA01v4_12811 [Colletotrichum graminicola]|nr:hypothetical protein CGRA01v4_12811 [Colletotrichum graminicola]
MPGDSRVPSDVPCRLVSSLGWISSVRSSPSWCGCHFLVRHPIAFLVGHNVVGCRPGWTLLLPPGK